MAQDLIKKNEVVGVPANPVIVANLASLPGGVEVKLHEVSDTYPGGSFIDEEHGGLRLPKILIAGYPVAYNIIDGMWHAHLSDDNVPACDGGVDPDVCGAVLSSSPAYYDEEEDCFKCTCSIMVVGVVDAKCLRPLNCFEPEMFNGGNSRVVYINPQH